MIFLKGKGFAHRQNIALNTILKSHMALRLSFHQVCPDSTAFFDGTENYLLIYFRWTMSLYFKNALQNTQGCVSSALTAFFSAVV